MKLSRNKTLNILKDHHNYSTKIREGFPGGSLGKNPPVSVGDAGSILGAERSPEEENGNPLQCSCLGNTMDRGAWWVTAHGVIKYSDRT